MYIGGGLMQARPRWGFMDIIVVYLAILGVNVIAALLPVKDMLNEEQYYLYGFGVQFLATVILVYLFAVLFHRGRLSDLGIRRASLGKIWRYGILGGFLLVIMVLIMGIVLQYFQPNLQPQYIEEILRSSNQLPEFLAVMTAGVILAPVAEEIFYRGMIYPVFRKYLGTGWGAVAAGLIFGAAHWDLWRTIPLAIGGALLCYIYEKSGSILVSMVAHGIWNGVMCILIYLSFSVSQI